MELGLKDKVAVIGASSKGLGRAIALGLAEEGTKVVICSRTADELEAAAARIAKESGSACLAVPTDVKDEAACIELVRRTVATFGRVDVLINNAGGTRMGPLESIPTKGWDSIYLTGDKFTAYVKADIERVTGMLAMLGRQELANMMAEDKPTEIVCNFCRERYEVPHEELARIAGAGLDGGGSRGEA